MCELLAGVRQIWAETSISFTQEQFCRARVSQLWEGGGGVQRGFSVSAAANVSLIRELCDVRAETLLIPVMPTEVKAQTQTGCLFASIRTTLMIFTYFLLLLLEQAAEN